MNTEPLRYQDVTPIDWLGQLWITLEVVCGYLMLGGLISIFASKFRGGVEVLPGYSVSIAMTGILLIRFPS